MTLEITVCISTIPPRAKKLRQALWSVIGQTQQPNAIVVEFDHLRTGAAATKNRALAQVQTEWVAFLDDDDQFMPEHLEKLSRAQQESDADVIYSMPHIPQMADTHDPQGRRGLPFDADELRKRSYIQTTSLVRTDLFKRSGGFQIPDQRLYPGSIYDDHGAWLALLDHGAKFFHLPEQTFYWQVDGGNTSGLPSRW
jgi:glycosyltransferase involved in cell wall biosynthesis